MKTMKTLVLGVVGALAVSATQVLPASAFEVGGTLGKEQSAYTADGKMMLRYQADGNLVVYNPNSFYSGNGAGTALWASGTEGLAADYVTFRNGQLQFIRNSQIVHKISIGRGTAVCVTAQGRPVGCH